MVISLSDYGNEGKKMKTLEQEIRQWSETLRDFHLPRWEELPDLDLYMDQLITLIDTYLSPVIHSEKHALLTASMVNNYVKNGMIPAPTKKRYNRRHLAFLIAITLLKQVLTIEEVKDGILFQGRTNGIRQAYDLFCEEQERALQQIYQQITQQPASIAPYRNEVQYFAVRSATMAFANKLLAEKMIELEKIYLKENSHEHE